MSEHFSTRQTLIVNIRNQHNDAAWEDFVFYYRAWIFTVVLRLNVAKADADDVVQRVLLTLWKKLPEFEYQPERCKFRSWMSNVIRKEVLQYFRTRGRYQRRLEKAGEQEIDNGVELPDIYSIAEDEWKSHVSSLAWQNIKDDFQGKAAQCFLLFSEGKSVEEICEQLEIKANSAYKLRSRVVDRLCKEIRRLDDELS